MPISIHPGKRLALCAAAFFIAVPAQSQQLQPLPNDEIQRRQTQQLEEAQNRAARAHDVLTPSGPAALATFILPQETPCFTIREVAWQGIEELHGIASQDKHLLNQCVGGKGIRAFQDRIASQLIGQGFITSQVIVPDQNLSSGRLVLHVLAGRIGEIRNQGQPAGEIRLPLPASTSTGAIFNQRDFDQTLENIRRLASQQAVEFEYAPNATPGVTDITIKHPEAKKWRGNITLDDSGSDETGKYQLGGMLIVDSPLRLYDAFTITVNNNANIGNNTLGTQSFAMNWSVPIGYWSLFLGWNQTRYKQTVAGFQNNILYSGKSRNVEIGIDYVPYRTANAKGAMQFKLVRKLSRSYIDDAEIDVQHRDVTGYEAVIGHRQWIGPHSIDIKAGVKASLPGESNASGWIAGQPDWDGRYRIYTGAIHVMAPFQLTSHALRYQGNVRLQRATTLLPAAEYFSIGNRYSVRGFDGSATLAAESGWTFRNELAYLWRQHPHETFIGLDTGRVSGPSADALLGHALTGAALGLRGQLDRWHYEGTIGIPLHRPGAFFTRRPVWTVFVAADF